MRTGQQRAFLLFIRHSALQLTAIDSGGEGGGFASKAWSRALAVARAIRQMLMNRPDRLYMTASSKPMAFVFKDAPILFAARLLRIPVINHLHGNGFSQARAAMPMLARAVLDAAYRSIRLSIVLDPRMKYHFDAYARYMSLRTIMNASELADCPTATQTPGDRGLLRVLFLSNIQLYKGLLDLTEAVRRFESSEGRGLISLEVVGTIAKSISDISAEELAAELGSLSSARYLGPLDGEAKLAALHRADVFVFPSYHPSEASPLSVIEALSAGLFVIASRIGYVDELLSGTEHRLISPRDISGLAAALRDASNNPGLLDRARAMNPNTARRRFSVNRYAAELDDAITALS